MICCYCLFVCLFRCVPIKIDVFFSKLSSFSTTVEGQSSDELAPSMGAKTLCIPFDQPKSITDETCVYCPKPATCYTLFGRSY